MARGPRRRAARPRAAVADLLARALHRLPAAARRRRAQGRPGRAGALRRLLRAARRAPRLRRRAAETFEDWVCDRFGRRLFELFFKSYTEKVWGVPTSQISADWAAQRIRTLSFSRVVRAALLNDGGDVRSLIERVPLPALRARSDVGGDGGRDRRRRRPGAPRRAGRRASSSPAVAWPPSTPAGERVAVDRRHLLAAAARRRRARRPAAAAPPCATPPPGCATATSSPSRSSSRGEDLFPDNWIYVHDPGVRVGRIQNFRAWSPAMVPDAERTCVGPGVLLLRGRRPLERERRASSSRARRASSMRSASPPPIASRPATSCACRRPIRSTTPTTTRASRRSAAGWTGSRTCSRSAATACTATTTPTTRC